MTPTFSDTYLRPLTLQDDSKRMRAQLAAAYVSFIASEKRHTVRRFIQQHSGVMAKSSGTLASLDLHFHAGSLRDVLDSVTAVADWFRDQQREIARQNWLNEVQRIFDQQHVKFTLNQHGTVRLRVDASFETNREAALTGLHLPRYGAVRTEFEAAYEALAATQADGKQAIRGIFEACEVTFKLMFPAVKRIGAPEIGTSLVPFVEQHYAGDPPARESAKKLVQSFAAWVASAQFYRHGQGQEEPNHPPLELAVAILSEGTAHLRWLIHLDQANLGDSA